MKLVLISLDAVWAGDKEKLLATRHIGPLLQKGLRSFGVQTVYPTLTYPIHVSMVTGQKPCHHGIAHNQPFDPAAPGGISPAFREKMKKAGVKENACRPWHWDHRDIQGETLFDACYREGKTVMSILWPVTGKHRGIRWNFPEVLAMPWENQTLKMLRYGSPLWLLSTELRLGRRRVSSREPHLSDYAIELACDRLRRRNSPDLTAIHLVDLDAMRHHHGVQSPEALAAIDRMDQRVGRILEALHRGGHEEDTCLFLVCDHGQEDVDTYVRLGDHLKGEPVQVQALGRGAYLRFVPGYEAQAPRLARVLEGLPGVGRVFEKPQLEAMGAPRDVILAVDAGEGVLFTDGMAEGETEKATHGFAADHPTAQCLLSLTGPGVAQEEREAMAVTDIAGIAAGILGLRWRPNREKW